jgi:DNA-binding XRE family transcriptional regulator
MPKILLDMLRNSEYGSVPEHRGRLAETMMTVTPLKRKLRMMERGVTQQKLADKLGVTQEAVSSVMRGRTRTPRIRAAICQALGWPERRIWPDERKTA